MSKNIVRRNVRIRIVPCRQRKLFSAWESLHPLCYLDRQRRKSWVFFSVVVTFVLLAILFNLDSTVRLTLFRVTSVRLKGICLSAVMFPVLWHVLFHNMHCVNDAQWSVHQSILLQSIYYLKSRHGPPFWEMAMFSWSLNNFCVVLCCPHRSKAMRLLRTPPLFPYTCSLVLVVPAAIKNETGISLFRGNELHDVIGGTWYLIQEA